MKIIKYSFLFLSLIYSIASLSQKDNCTVQLHILEKVFNNYHIITIKKNKVFETKVWNQHANIPLDNCHLAQLNNGITVIAFEIYISQSQDDYKNMIEENTIFKANIGKEAKYQGNGERLIQVLFFNTKTDKFIGKPNGFPITNLSWMMESPEEPIIINEIIDLKENKSTDNVIILQIKEHSGYNPERVYYVFKYDNGKIHSSGKIIGCLDEIREENNSLYAKLIDNCFAVEKGNEEPEIYESEILTW